MVRCHRDLVDDEEPATHAEQGSEDTAMNDQAPNSSGGRFEDSEQDEEMNERYPEGDEQAALLSGTTDSTNSALYSSDSYQKEIWMQINLQACSLHDLRYM